MSNSRVEELRAENKAIREKIALFRNNDGSANLKGEIVKFVEESKRNLNNMNNKIIEENSRQNEALHGLTTQYEAVLKKQIELLTQNKKLNERKQAQDKVFNENIEKLTHEYESQIKQFQEKVKVNVKKIQDLSGSNIINRLLKNQRFRAAMEARGCSLDSLQKQSELEQVSLEVEGKQKQILEAEEKSVRLDQQLSKMHELIDTMKSLMENMMKEKENILKQNSVLKQKLKQSEDLIGKLLGKEAVEEQNQDEEEAEDIEDQEQQGQDEEVK